MIRTLTFTTGVLVLVGASACSTAPKASVASRNPASVGPELQGHACDEPADWTEIAGFVTYEEPPLEQKLTKDDTYYRGGRHYDVGKAMIEAQSRLEVEKSGKPIEVRHPVNPDISCTISFFERNTTGSSNPWPEFVEQGVRALGTINLAKLPKNAIEIAFRASSPLPIFKIRCENSSGSRPTPKEANDALAWKLKICKGPLR